MPAKLALVFLMILTGIGVLFISRFGNEEDQDRREKMKMRISILLVAWLAIVGIVLIFKFIGA